MTVLGFCLSLLISFLGSGFGILGALFLYRIRLKRDEKIKAEDAEFQYIARLKYFNLLIKRILKCAKKQLGNYQVLANEIRKEPNEIHLVKLIVFRDIQRIHQMDSEEIFRAYLSVLSENNETIQKYQEIYANIDFVEEILKQRESAQEKHILFTYGDQKRLKEIIDGLAEDIRSLLFSKRENLATEINYTNNPIIIDLSKLLEEYFNLVKNKGKLNDFEKGFSEPLRNLIFEKYSNQDFSNFLLVKSRQAASILKNIEFNSFEYCNDIDKIKEELASSFSKLECTSNVIEQAIKKHIKDVY